VYETTGCARAERASTASVKWRYGFCACATVERHSEAVTSAWSRDMVESVGGCRRSWSWMPGSGAAFSLASPTRVQHVERMSFRADHPVSFRAQSRNLRTLSFRAKSRNLHMLSFRAKSRNLHF